MVNIKFGLFLGHPLLRHPLVAGAILEEKVEEVRAHPRSLAD